MENVTTTTSKDTSSEWTQLPTLSTQTEIHLEVSSIDCCSKNQSLVHQYTKPRNDVSVNDKCKTPLSSNECDLCRKAYISLAPPKPEEHLQHLPAMTQLALFSVMLQLIAQQLYKFKLTFWIICPRSRCLFFWVLPWMCDIS